MGITSIQLMKEIECDGLVLTHFFVLKWNFTIPDTLGQIKVYLLGFLW